MAKKYQTLAEFYPYYLTEHKDLTCRTLHFIGTFGIFILLFASIFLQDWRYFAAIPVCGYGFAWFGHAVFEKNKPATFEYPLFSLASDFIMFWHILTGQIGAKLADAKQKIESAN